MLHTLTFTAPPSNEGLRQAVQDLGIHCYRYIDGAYSSIIFTIEELDMWETLKWEPKAGRPEASRIATRVRCLSAADLKDFV